MSKAAELAALIGSQTAFSNKNMIINGAMQVAQRGTSSTSTGYTTVDRFRTTTAATDELAFTQSQSTTVPSGEGGKYFISAQLGVSASGSVVHRSDVYIYVNGSKVATSTGFDSNNTQYSVFANIALSLDLSAGDYVEVYNYNDVSSGTPVARASDKQSYFTGFKIT